MSKFLKLCANIQNILNEQDEQTIQPSDNQSEMQQTTSNQQEQLPQQEDQQSELPIVSNDKIAELANALKIFYSKEDSKIKDEDVKQILTLNPRNSKESQDIVKIIDTLTNIFNPVSIKTEPEDVKTSSTE